MKATTLIERLQNLVNTHGNGDVFLSTDDVSRYHIDNITWLPESIDFAESDGDEGWPEGIYIGSK